ncbi:hypothetical protein MOQ19_01330 [Stenotrophomonas maltophilia]|nr:hypothetical protein [Stenotrophomonas maltophilia]
MSNDNKTLADVQPGGRVRLGDQAELDRLEFQAWARSIGARVDADEHGNYVDANLNYAKLGWNAALSAQPSPGRQDALKALDDLAAFCSDDTETVKRHVAVIRAALAARQPVGEPVAWMTHHDEPMLFPTAAEASAYCEDDEQPVPLFRSPAQAVDLGQLPRAVELLSNVSRTLVDWAAEEQREAIGIVKALIDSQAVGNG